MEGMSSNNICNGGGSSDGGNAYIVHHDPFAYFSNIANDPVKCQQVIPAGTYTGGTSACNGGTPSNVASTLISDLGNPSTAPSFIWVTPNNYDNMHDCSSSSQMIQGDNWLSVLVPSILQTATFTGDATATVIVTFDEPSSGTYGTTPVYFVVAGPGAKASYTSSIHYTHYSLLATIENNWGLLGPATCLGNSCSALPMSEFFVPNFGVFASPSSVSIQQGYSAVSQITVTSLNGFGGTVALTATPSVNVCGFTVVWSGQNWNGCSSSNVATTTVSVASGGSTSVQLNIGVCLSTPPGAYSVSVSGASGSLSHATTIAVQVLSGPGCDSGSVAAGTLITLANGDPVPVQNLQVGMQLLSYNMVSQKYVVTTINQFTTVQVDNLMIIQTGTGPPLRVDQNPAQKVYVKLPNGMIQLVSVTDLQVGYDLFQALSQTWVPITDISYINHGQYVMYDIYTTTPGNYIANGYLDPNKR